MTDKQQEAYPAYCELTNRIKTLDTEIDKLRKQMYALQSDRKILVQSLNEEEALVKKGDILLTSIDEATEVTNIDTGWTSQGEFYRTYNLARVQSHYTMSFSEEEFKEELASGKLRKKTSEKEWTLPKAIRLHTIQFTSQKQDTAICSTKKGRLFLIRVRDSWRDTQANIIYTDENFIYYLNKGNRRDYYKISIRNTHTYRKAKRDTLFTCDILAVGTEKADLLAYLI